MSGNAKLTVDDGVLGLFPRFGCGEVLASGRMRGVPFLVRSNGLGALCGYLSFDRTETLSWALVDLCGVDVFKGGELPMHGGQTFSTVGREHEFPELPPCVTVVGCDWMHAGDELRAEWCDDGCDYLLDHAPLPDGSFPYGVDDVVADLACTVDWMYGQAEEDGSFSAWLAGELGVER